VLFTPCSKRVLQAGSWSRSEPTLPGVVKLSSGLGHNGIVANPRRVRLIYASRTKRDRLDAEALARLGRLDPNLLSPITHHGGATRADLAIVRARDELVQVRSKLVNHARGVVKSLGERLPRCDAASFHRRVRGLIPASLRPALHPILDVLQELEVRIKTYERMIEARLDQAYPEARRLTRVPGVGAQARGPPAPVVGERRRFRSAELCAVSPREARATEEDAGVDARRPPRSGDCDELACDL